VSTHHDSRIIVHVVDKTAGTPIPGAEIRTFVAGETETHEHTTDANGVFALALAGGAPEFVRITVHAKGYVRQSVELWDLREQNLPRAARFSLEKGIAIGGVVHDHAGQPVEGATVEVFSHEGQSQEFERPRDSIHFTLTTDDHGRWRSDAVPVRIGSLSFNVRHPGSADTHFSMPRDLKFEDLRAERAVMVLNEGLKVTGCVTDATGAPIAGAALVAGRHWYDGQWTETDAAGCFGFEPLTAMPVNGTFLLTVQARGFAPQRRELPADANLSPVVFVLRPARLLVGRVVDSEGKPLADVSVSAEDWNGATTIKWREKTDPNGRLVWNDPPADAIQISLYKAGYASSQRRIVANDREHTFILVKTMTIQGAVTDRRTGEPIRRFKVVPGRRSDYGNRISWNTADTATQWFTDGRYSHAFLFEAPAYAVRIEAEGYMPQESGLVDANEQTATVDVALTESRREKGPSGYLFDANVRPVAGARVFWGKPVFIYEGRVDVTRDLVYTTTNDEGRFIFEPANRQDPFLAVCDQGIGSASYEELARDGFIMLRAWARVEGEWRIGNRPAAHRELQLLPWYDEGLPHVNLDRAKAVTDENGRFVFEKVYPGKFTLCNESYWALPGQTLELHLGGIGRTVKGELLLSVTPDVPIRTTLQLALVNVPVPFDKIPRPPGYERMSLAEVRAWLTQFNDSPEGKAYSIWVSQNHPQIDKRLHVTMDDRCRFHVDNVEPGVYILKGEVSSGGWYDSRMMSVAPGHEHLLSKPVGSVWYEFEVPPPRNTAEIDIPFDLGTLPVRPEIKPKPGDPAPDFDVPAFGPDHIRLADHRGKVVLLTFLHRSCIDKYPQGLEELKAMYRRFHQDARYAQVGLLFREHPLLDKKAIDEAGLNWPHGLLDGYGCKEARDYDMPSKMLWNVLIGPRGEIVATDLSGEALQQAVEAALRTAR
jgi:protocatechuate 3,4-dioxygenase beta subunit/peroxiredoxin